MYKNWYLKREVGITIKVSKQVTNSNQSQEISMHHPVLPAVYQSQMHVQIKHSLVHLQDLIPNLAGVFRITIYFIPAIVRIKTCRCARECFICTCI